jgi:hypothetical protein
MQHPPEDYQRLAADQDYMRHLAVLTRAENYEARHWGGTYRVQPFIHRLFCAGQDALDRVDRPTMYEDGGWCFSEAGDAALDKAIAAEWRKITREIRRPCEWEPVQMRMRQGWRMSPMRRAGCRPRERRDGRRRKSSSASSGDPDEPGPGEARLQDVAAPSIARWSR